MLSRYRSSTHVGLFLSAFLPGLWAPQESAVEQVYVFTLKDSGASRHFSVLTEQRDDMVLVLVKNTDCGLDPVPLAAGLAYEQLRQQMSCFHLLSHSLLWVT